MKQDLIQMLQDSLQQAEQLSRSHYLHSLEEFLDEDMQPRCMTLKLPVPDKEGMRIEECSYPLLCLVPLQPLQLKEVEMSFSARLYGEHSFLAETKEDASPLVLTVPGKEKEDNQVQVHLTFRSGKPPEGVLQLQDRLSNFIPR